MPGLHSRLSPSSGHRWSLCAYAPTAEEGLPDTAGIEAAEGTVFHEVAAWCAEFGLDPALFHGFEMDVDDRGLIPFNEEMRRSMYYGLDCLWDFEEEHRGDIIVGVENKLDLSAVSGEGEFGTSDYFAIVPSKRKLRVFDWKYGIGIPVAPEKNVQAILYVLGVWDTYAWKHLGYPEDVEVEIIIEQPRAEGGGGVWNTTMVEILEMGDKLREAADATREVNPVATPGPKQCQFCKAARFKTCEPYLQYVLDLFDMDLAQPAAEEELGLEPVLLPPSKLPPERVAYLLQHRKMLTKFLDECHADMYADYLADRPTPGMKMVAGRALPMAWKDENKSRSTIKVHLGAKATKTKWATPAQCRDELGKKEFHEVFERHVTMREPKPQLVPVYDPRPALKTRGQWFDEALEDSELI